MLHSRLKNWGNLLLLSVLIASQSSAQPLPATIASKQVQHIQLFGHTVTDSVTIEELIRAGGFQSIHPSIRIQKADVIFPGLCIGCTLGVTPTTGKFDDGLIVLIRQLKPGSLMMIENIEAKDEHSRVVKLRPFCFYIK